MAAGVAARVMVASGTEEGECDAVSVGGAVAADDGVGTDGGEGGSAAE